MTCLFTAKGLPLYRMAQAMVLALLVAGVAYADGGPHGSYIATSDSCAACHRTHTSAGSGLLAAATSQALCDMCHDGTGSIYNAEAGRIQIGGNDAPSLAGPLRMTGAGGPATSAHAQGAVLTPPGGRPAAVGLGCVACHDPHGSSNYRLFRRTVVWNDVGASVTFTATLINPGTLSEAVAYGSGSVAACAACHTDYAQRSGGTFSAGTRHRVNVAVGGAYFPADLPLENGRLVCLTCHRAHGTTVVNTAASGQAAYSTVLKRRGDFGLCSQCHFNR